MKFFNVRRYILFERSKCLIRWRCVCKRKSVFWTAYRSIKISKISHINFTKFAMHMEHRLKYLQKFDFTPGTCFSFIQIWMHWSKGQQFEIYREGGEQIFQSCIRSRREFTFILQFLYPFFFLKRSKFGLVWFGLYVNYSQFISFCPEIIFYLIFKILRDQNEFRAYHKIKLLLWIEHRQFNRSSVCLCVLKINLHWLRQVWYYMCASINLFITLFVVFIVKILPFHLNIHCFVWRQMIILFVQIKNQR